MIEIVQLGAGEVARLRKIRLASLADSPDAFASTYQEATARPRSEWLQQIRDLVTFIAVKDGKDCGIVRGVPNLVDGDEVYLVSMWVAPAARCHGVGEALVDALLCWARSAGYKKMLLNVIETNRNAAALYDRLGFEVTGKLTALPAPREHLSEIEMALELRSQ